MLASPALEDDDNSEAESETEAEVEVGTGTGAEESGNDLFKPLNFARGSFSWYGLHSDTLLGAPPMSLAGRTPGDLFINHAWKSAKSRYWVAPRNTGMASAVWEITRAGSMHPTEEGYVLDFHLSGVPTWVLGKTYRDRGRRRRVEKKGKGEERNGATSKSKKPKTTNDNGGDE